MSGSKSPGGRGGVALLMRAAVTLALLMAAMPPGWFAGAGFLMIPGLGMLYALATDEQIARPRRLAALVAGLWFLCFSWSVRHFATIGGPIVIGLIIVILWRLLFAWAGVLARWVPGSLAFGLVVAAGAWLRTHWPEIPYPHGQPAHCLYHWPELLGPVRWFGEEGMNFLIAALGAGLVDLARSWRVARPSWRPSVGVVLGLCSVWLVAALVAPDRDEGEPTRAVRVLALQPNFNMDFQLGSDYWQAVEKRLKRRTEIFAGAPGSVAPDLVLWPESTWPAQVTEVEGKLKMTGRYPVELHAGTRLVVGTELRIPRHVPAAALIDHQGQLLGIHEKLVPVPAGEYLPFSSILPGFLRDGVESIYRKLVGGVPDIVPGEFRPLLHTAPPLDVPFAALLCYDNAFPAVARTWVDKGARFLVVLSNEAWYRGGSELDQMEAMTVVRALETATPIVRCTVDGLSLHVNADGRVVARKARKSAETVTETTILSAEVTPGSGALPPMAWLRKLWVAIMLASSVPLAWQLILSLARSLRAKPVDSSPPGSQGRDDASPQSSA